MPLSAQEIICGRYKNKKNPVTPNRIKIGKISKNIAFEICSGKCVFNTIEIFSVVVVEKQEEEFRTIKGDVFENIEACLTYVKNLKKELSC